MSKEVTPKQSDYLCQSYDFSRARHTLSLRYRKLLHVVMTQAQLDGKAVELTFLVGDLVKAFAKSDDSGKAYKTFRLDSFSDGLMKEILTVPDAAGGWTKLQWVSLCQYDKLADTLRVQLHAALLPYVLDYRRRYTVVTLEQINRFAGRHAWKYYELFSTEKFRSAGAGNTNRDFFLDMSVREIRAALSIADTEYKRTDSFSLKAVHNPIEEINSLNLGLKVEAQPRYRRSYLVGFRFLCTVYDPAKSKPVKPPTPEELSQDEHIAQHQEEYDAILAEERSQGDLIHYKNSYERETAILKLAYQRYCKKFPLKKKVGRPRKKNLDGDTTATT